MIIFYSNYQKKKNEQKKKDKGLGENDR